VAAVCTAVAGSVALMVYNAAVSTEGSALQPKAHPGQVLVPAGAAARLTPDRVRAIERELPTRASLSLTVLAEAAMDTVESAPEYRRTGLPAMPSRVVAIGGGELIRAVTGAEPPLPALAALRDGGAVAFYPTLVARGQLAIGERTRLPAVLAATAVAVGLATAEMRDDLSTLAAVGAGPRLRRRLAAAQAALIVGAGVLLGVAGGIAPAAGMVALRRDPEWHLPWLPLTVTVLLAPVLAVGTTAALTRPRLVHVRRLG
jgi:hypothetical protein